MRIFTFSVILLISLRLPGQTDPMAFFNSEDPMEVLAAYQMITDTNTTTRIATEASDDLWRRQIPASQIDGNGIFSPGIAPINDKWTWIKVNGYVHPAIAPLIAKTMGWKSENVRAVARFEEGYAWEEFIELENMDDALAGYSGMEIIRRELGTTDRLVRLNKLNLKNEDLVFDKIPVPPLRLRPESRPHLNYCLRTLKHYSRLYAFAEEKNVRRWLDYLVQRYFEVLTGLFANPNVNLFEHIPYLEADYEMEWFSRAENAGYVVDSSAHAVLFTQDDLILVQEGPELYFFNLPNQKRVRDLPRLPGRLIRVNDQRRIALFIDWDGMLQIDLKSGEWVQETLADMNYVTADEELEVSHLINWKTGGVLRQWLVPDYPVVEACSPGGQYILLEDKEGSGAIFSTQSGLPVGELEYPFSYDGFEEETAYEDVEFGKAAALVRYGEQWLTFRHNTLRSGSGLRYVVKWKPNAGSFSPDGTQLVLIGDRKGCLLKLEKALKSGNADDLEIECWKK